MSWISGNRYLSTTEQQNNALIIREFFRARGWTLNAIAGMLGNIEVESTVNPGIWESFVVQGDGNGFGLVQWTPWTKYQQWAGADWQTNYNKQLERIIWEMDNGEQYYPTNSYPETFREFSQSTKSAYYLAGAFLYNYERPAEPDPADRGNRAEVWYKFLQGSGEFVPRLDAEGIYQNPYYYDQNPFYQSGYGLPNCTCYAWGRFWEITGKRPKLPLYNGNEWLPDVVESGVYKTGTTPRLGAVVCYDNASAGHVAIVEQIHTDGSFTISQSAYYRPISPYPPDTPLYFYTSLCDASSKKPAGSNYIFQGFIYNDASPAPPQPVPTDKPPVWLYFQFRKGIK